MLAGTPKSAKNMKVYIITSNQKTLNKVIIIGLYVFLVLFILSSIMYAFTSLEKFSRILIIFGITDLIIAITLLFIKWVNKKYIIIEENTQVLLIINSKKSLIEITRYKDIKYEGNFLVILNEQFEINNKQAYECLNSSLTKNIVIESKPLKEFEQDPIEILKHFDSL
jgi:hypothetical protein